jgi:NAD(P)H-flavin reductase
MLVEHTLAEPMAPVPCRVRSVRTELADTFTLEIEPPEGSLRFAPGQFTMLYVLGVGEVPISISGDPGDPTLLVHTIRSVGAVTRALGLLGPGDLVGVRGPFGTSWPVDQAEGTDVVIVAGGIGLAPLRSAIYHIRRHRERYGGVAILYGARTPGDVLFSDELYAWQSQPDLTVLLTVDTADRSWRGSVGLVTRLVDRTPMDPDRTTAFVCGPEVMMRFSAGSLTSRGVPAGRVHLSIERNMKCAIGFCGHCQFGGAFVCRDGPVFPMADVAHLLTIREV